MWKSSPVHQEFWSPKQDMNLNLAWHATLTHVRPKDPRGSLISKPFHCNQLLVFLSKDLICSTCRAGRVHVFWTITVESSWGMFLNPFPSFPMWKNWRAHQGYYRQTQSPCQFVVLLLLGGDLAYLLLGIYPQPAKWQYCLIKARFGSGRKSWRWAAAFSPCTE